MEKVVLITGASRGIGAAAARCFAAHGWAVAVNYVRSREKAEALAKEVCGLAVRADVSDEAAVEAMFSEVERTLGRVSALVNNAGVAHIGLFQDMSAGEWDRLFAVNVRGAFLCARRAVPGMINSGGGAIVNVSSMWGAVGGSCEAAYSASKAALIGFTKALAKELGPSGIRVNCVTPGLINTDMNRELSPEDISAVCDETPLGRMGTPEEAAEAIWWLTERGAFTTGAVLGVNGGLVV